MPILSLAAQTLLMPKEIFLAVFAGSILGLVIAFGIWRANLALKPQQVPVEQQSASFDPTTGQFGLSLNKPQNEDLVTVSPTTLSGVTKAGSWITVSTESQDYLLQAENNGSFEQAVELGGGVNQIVVTAFDEDGDSIEQNINIVYSTEFEKQQ